MLALVPSGSVCTRLINSTRIHILRRTLVNIDTGFFLPIGHGSNVSSPAVAAVRFHITRKLAGAVGTTGIVGSAEFEGVQIGVARGGTADLLFAEKRPAAVDSPRALLHVLAIAVRIHEVKRRAADARTDRLRLRS